MYDTELEHHNIHSSSWQGSKNPGFFFKKPNPVGFFGFYWFFGQAGKK